MLGPLYWFSCKSQMTGSDVVKDKRNPSIALSLQVNSAGEAKDYYSKHDWTQSLALFS